MPRNLFLSDNLVVKRLDGDCCRVCSSLRPGGSGQQERDRKKKKDETKQNKTKRLIGYKSLSSDLKECEQLKESRRRDNCAIALLFCTFCLVGQATQKGKRKKFETNPMRMASPTYELS